MLNALTVDVEDWFHILGSSTVPTMADWSALEPRVRGNMEKILDLLGTLRVQATFFWLGWVAERNKSLVRRCLQEGHEIASHGYGHVLPHEVGERRFHADIIHAKTVLEDISGKEIPGFRAAGFGVLETTPWAFDVIRESGHEYDASVFPARHGHGGIVGAPLVPHFIATNSGRLFEIPASVIQVLGRRVSLFGGGYLRLVTQPMLKCCAMRLMAQNRPLIVYFHPRDIDPNQPRLPLPPIRRFKCYVNLRGTFDKIKWLCEACHFGTMFSLMDNLLSRSAGYLETVPTPCGPRSAATSPVARLHPYRGT